jgi:hypothetical protein
VRRKFLPARGSSVPWAERPIHPIGFVSLPKMGFWCSIPPALTSWASRYIPRGVSSFHLNSVSWRLHFCRLQSFSPTSTSQNSLA